MKAIIVDDEPKAISLLQQYLEHFPDIQVAGSFRNGLKALSFLNSERVDIIFLDVNMPHISGMSIAKLIDQQIRIVFTTAYAEYAVESYELAAVDYLLKPITLERFTQAVQKILKEPGAGLKDPPEKTVERILVKSGSRLYQLEPNQIYYLEKDHNYLLYHLKAEKIMARQSTAEALAVLPDHFMQIHKSFIVNLDRVEFFDRHEVSVNARMISLGASFRAAFLERML